MSVRTSPRTQSAQGDVWELI